jgi:steroid delta-isomerase-like uncharacterized protein
MTDQEKNLDIAKRWIEAMNNHDAELMGSYCSEDAQHREIPEPEAFHGRTGIIKAARELFSGFPDCTSKIINAFSGDGQVVIEVLWEGTNKGEFKSTPATGKRVKIQIGYVFKLKNNRIKEISEYYDGYTVMKQMAMI